MTLVANMKKWANQAAWLCGNNCGVRVNVAVTTIIPAIDQLQRIFPTLRDYLPPNVYGAGFVILAVANAILHIRTTPPPP